MKPRIVSEICRTIRSALPDWGRTLRLCLIIAVLTACVLAITGVSG
jgi:hypothetical protein